MKILIISASPVSSLFGKAMPFSGLQCIVESLMPTDGLTGFDCVIDLDFENNPERIALYKKVNLPVLIGSVVHTLKELNTGTSVIARFNHWPVFISRNCIEVAVTKANQSLFHSLFNQWSIPFFETADEPGFVSARTVSMIINEAFLAKEENVSTADEINIAMKLGTSYPFGPFEWYNQTGPERIIQLLQKLAATDQRYQPALSLIEYKVNP